MGHLQLYWLNYYWISSSVFKNLQYLPNLAVVLNLLYNFVESKILKLDNSIWWSFNKYIKHLETSARVPIHFDPDLSFKLSTDGHK